MTSTPKKMEPQEAYKIIQNAAYEGCITSSPYEVRLALDVLSSLHVHFSRFKVGDEVWVVYLSSGPGGWDVRVSVVTMLCFGSACWCDTTTGRYPESDCFPTREAAEAECAKRNGIATPKDGE